jgi:hypothetical protein
MEPVPHRKLTTGPARDRAGSEAKVDILRLGQIIGAAQAEVEN